MSSQENLAVEMSSVIPKSVIGVIGPPRSGTTLVANSLISHSQASGIIEPYQVRRDENYSETDPMRVISDFKVNVSTFPNIFIKETTTRAKNVESIFKLLENAKERGIYTGLIIILRNPYEAYLSQVEASSKIWKQKRMTTISENTFDVFSMALLGGLRRICKHARAQHFRLVSYEGFCASPETELSRLMALVPLKLEKPQLNFSPPGKIGPGGDPKTEEKAGSISRDSRKEAVADLRSRFTDRPLFGFFEVLNMLIQNTLGKAPDKQVIDELTRISLKNWKG